MTEQSREGRGVGARALWERHVFFLFRWNGRHREWEGMFFRYMTSTRNHGEATNEANDIGSGRVCFLGT